MRRRKTPQFFVKCFKTANRLVRKALRVTKRPIRALKEIAMKMASQFAPQEWGTRTRTLASLALVGTFFLLTACGGGGGGGGGANPPSPITPPVVQSPPPPPPPAPTPSGTVAETDNCDIEANAAACEGRVRVANLNVTGATLVVGDGPGAMTIPVPGNGDVVIPLSGEGERKLTLRAGDGTVLDGADGTKTVASQCEAGATWDTAQQKCVVVPSSQVYYSRMSLMLSGQVFDGSDQGTGNGTIGVGYPQILIEGKWKPVKNETGVQVGLCELSLGKLDNGLLSARCRQPQLNNATGVFPITPDGRLLPEYMGTLPEGVVYQSGPYGVFGQTPYVQFGVSNQGMYIDVPGVGTFYYTDTRGDELRLTRDGFATYEVVQTGQTFKVLVTNTNPAPTN